MPERYCGICDRHLPERAFYNWENKRICIECQKAMHRKPATVYAVNLLTNPPPRVEGKCLIGACTYAATHDGLCWNHNFYYRESPESQDLCPGCGRAVIERDWYQLRAYHLDDAGHCRACGAQLAGVFDGPPGDWGRRRVPVRLAEVVR